MKLVYPLARTRLCESLCYICCIFIYELKLFKYNKAELFELFSALLVMWGGLRLEMSGYAGI